jgi:hypothetical protein
MGKKSWLYGIMVLTFVWGVTGAHAATCNIHVLAANLSAAQLPPGFTFILVIHNYAAGPQTFSVQAFLQNGTSRANTVTLDPDRFVLLAPGDIPILSGEAADIYVCWPPGAVGQPVQPGSVMLLAIGGGFTALPPITFTP